MAEITSPLGDAYRPGRYGNLAGGHGVSLMPMQSGSIVEVRAWGGSEQAVEEAIAKVCGIRLGFQPGSGAVGTSVAGFASGPCRMLLSHDEEGLAERLAEQLDPGAGALVDLSHGRLTIAIDGEGSGWVLPKLFALDFSRDVFPVGQGKLSAHHDITAAIQRHDDETFHIHVPRSFARSFWLALSEACEDVGYQVA
jgi:methylglutamate dehydrogenase subunit D